MTDQTVQPAWVQEFVQKYEDGVSHAFTLHFNVSDYVVPGVSLKTYITSMFQNRQCVVFYNRSEGLNFPLASHRDKFIELLGLNSPQSKAEATIAGLGDGPGPHRNDPKVALMLLTRLLRMGSQDDRVCAVVLEYAETLFPEGATSMDDRTNLVTALGWGRDPQIMGAGNPVFLVTENLTDLAGALRAASSRFESIEIPLPAIDARADFIRWYTTEHLPGVFDLEMTVDQLAGLTAGLSLQHIEDIILRAMTAGTLTVEMVKDRKDDIIDSEYRSVLEMWDPHRDFSYIGGLDHVKNFFVRNVIKPLREGRFQRVPMGILMTGPAGTGKSIMAEAVANESGINAVELNLARIFDQYVGTSERNLEKALRAIESLAPVLVFIDEIDQTVSRGDSGDSGVSNRIFKRLLEFMSDGDHRGRVVFLAATNRPDLMDAALRRPGRFDKKIPFLMPTATERAEIFRVMSRIYFGSEFEIHPSVIERTDGWTGAEIESAVVKSVEISEDENHAPGWALQLAVDRLRPSTADIEFMTLIALAEVNDLDLLPEEYREQFRNQNQIRQRIEEINPEPVRGRRAL